MTGMYPQIFEELVTEPMGSAEHTLGATVLHDKTADRNDKR